MKKRSAFALIGMAFAALAMSFGARSALAVSAEGEQSSEPAQSSSAPAESSSAQSSSYEPLAAATVSIAKCKNGTVSADILEGEVGDEVTLTVKADLLYKITSVSVNGATLIEDEETTGKYVFKLVAGINAVTASFELDGEATSAIADIIAKIKAGDWSEIFSVSNVLTIVKWVLDGGVLIALARYFIKNKRLESKVESAVKDTVEKIIPSETKETVLKVTEDVITPIFSQIKADNADMKKALSVFSKCLALSQENTAESRRAIIDELSGLKIGDAETINSIKEYIENLLAEHEKTYKETMAAIDSISKKNQEIVDKSEADAEGKNEDETNYGAL